MNSYEIIIFFIQGYNGIAIGKAQQNAKTEIEKLKFKDFTCAELVKEAAKV
jgi:20S proteasome subunit alpha 7